MRKKLLLIIFCFFTLTISNVTFADDDTEEWTKHLDVYNGDGLDKPVSAIDFKKTMQELQNLKDKKLKGKRLKKGEMPEPATRNEPVKIEKNDIIKSTTNLYYDGKIIPMGFYKVNCEEVNGEYFMNLIQGKTVIVKLKANKIPHASFAPNKVSAIETEIYQDKYFKINYKTIDYAVSGYLAIVK